MRAQIRKRQRMRRVTILLTIVIVGISLAVGVYFVATAGQNSSIDRSVGKPVSSSDLSELSSVSGQPYGPPPPSTMQGVLQKYAGTPYVSAGKPTVVYIGGDYCMYCAITRWSLIMALERFGSFSSLTYMASTNPSEGDLATFTFVGSSYTSQYISFRSYEAFDRSGNPLQSVPYNYSSLWHTKGGGIPFLNFGNTYVIGSSILADPTILAGKNWTAVLNDISTSSSAGLQIREGANLITAAICKVTQGAPSGVCNAPPIASEISSIAGPLQGSLSTGGSPSVSLQFSPPRVWLKRIG